MVNVDNVNTVSGHGAAKENKMAKTATHMGTCQLCGHFQKLPGGKLSVHGYTKQWGFFAGTCPGSRYLPFEVSVDRIEMAIADHTRAAAALRVSAAEVETSTEQWIHVYRPATWSNRKSGYDWVKVESFVEAGGKLTVTDAAGTVRDLGFFLGRHGIRNIDALWTLGRTNLAATRRSMADNHDKYIAWQRERIAGWKPQPLTAVAA